MTKLYPAFVFLVVLFCLNAGWPHFVEMESVAGTASAMEDGFQGFFRYMLSRIGLAD